MRTIYWIQRLSCINTISTILAILGAFAFIILLICAVVYKCDGLDYEHEKKAYAFLKKSVIWSVAITLFALLPVIFIPSKTEMYEIYGVGGTLDYVRKNETIKGLPDKTVKMLDKWLDDKLAEETTDKEKISE